jgi:hypothetical protein
MPAPAAVHFTTAECHHLPSNSPRCTTRTQKQCYLSQLRPRGWCLYRSPWFMFLVLATPEMLPTVAIMALPITLTQLLLLVLASVSAHS